MSALVSAPAVQGLRYPVLKKSDRTVIYPAAPLEAQLHRTGVVLLAPFMGLGSFQKIKQGRITTAAPLTDQRFAPVAFVFIDDQPRPVSQADIVFARSVLAEAQPGLVRAEIAGKLAIYAVSAREYILARIEWRKSAERYLELLAHATHESLSRQYRVPKSDQRETGTARPFWAIRSTLQLALQDGMEVPPAVVSHFGLAER